MLFDWQTMLAAIVAGVPAAIGAFFAVETDSLAKSRNRQDQRERRNQREDKTDICPIRFDYILQRINRTIA